MTDGASACQPDFGFFKTCITYGSDIEAHLLKAVVPRLINEVGLA
jgi:hypothetical protein